jgi:hypothetical protein
MSDECGTMSAGRDGIAEPVETMMTADSLRLTAHGPDEDEVRIVEELPKAKTPHEWADSSRPTTAGFQFTACHRYQNLRHLRNLRLLS